MYGFTVIKPEELSQFFQLFWVDFLLLLLQGRQLTDKLTNSHQGRYWLHSILRSVVFILFHALP